MKIKPFARKGNYTAIDNAVLDHFMPLLSANAWKTLCFIMRSTKGYQVECAQLKYSDIKTGTGISSDATLAKTIVELVSHQLIVVSTHKEHEGNYYELNRTLEIEVQNFSKVEVRESGTSKSELRDDAGTTENEVPIKKENIQDATHLGVERLTELYPVPLSGVFRHYLDELKVSKNKTNMIRTLIVALYGEDMAQAYGLIGKTASVVGGWGYLATRIWEMTSRPPNGNLMEYIMGEHRAKAARLTAAQRNGNHGGDPAIWHKLEETLPDYMQEESDAD